MATDVGAAPRTTTPELAAQWRSLTRAATFVAILTSPAVFVWLHNRQGVAVPYAPLPAVMGAPPFRGLMDIVFRRYLQTPSLFGEESQELRESDVVARRRVAFWRGM